MAATINPKTGRPTSEDWFWPETRGAAATAPHPLMSPGAGGMGEVFNATWRDPYVGGTPAQQQPTSTLSNLLTTPQMPTLSQGTSPAPAVNPFADMMAQQFRAPTPSAPVVQPFTPAPLPNAPVLQKAEVMTTTPQLTQAEQRLQDLISNPDSLAASASYKFRVQQGQQALERSLGARGLLQSGNRLTELTKYGQDMGSQEYEAENARRKAVLDAYLANLQGLNTSNIAATGVNNQGATSIYGTQVGGINSANQTAAQAKAAADQVANQQYMAQLDALAKQQGTLANLYSNADTTNTQRYGIDTTANTARAGTLADLYKTNVEGAIAQLPYQRQPLAAKPWWQV